MVDETRTPILIGESGASVVRIERAAGRFLIEKSGPASEIKAEAAIMRCCTGRLPVPQILQQQDGILIMSELPGTNLTEVSLEDAVNVLSDALSRIYALSVEDFPLSAHWDIRLRQAEERMEAGLVNEAGFDEENLGRQPADLLAELKALPPLPDLACLTHGDACLPNFLSHHGELSGIVDWGRAGVTHPAQDWALALRSMRSDFGLDGDRMLRERLPAHSADEDLLRRFRLLDEFF